MKRNMLTALVTVMLVGLLVTGCSLQIQVEPEASQMLVEGLETSAVVQTAAPEGTTPMPPTPAAEIIQPEIPTLHPEWTRYIDDIDGNAIGSLVVQGEIVWAGGADVIRLDTRSGDYVKLNTKFGLTDNSLTAMSAGPDGSIWFGTFGSGLSRLAVDGTWTTYTRADGQASDYVMAIAVGSDGSMWFGGSGGVSRLSQDGSWTTITTADGLAGDAIFAITSGLDGSIWFGTEVSGVSKLSTDGTWTTYTPADGLSSLSISAIVAAPDGSMWFGGVGAFGGYYAAPTGVSRLGADGTWTTYTTADGLAGDYVSAIAAGPDGSIWFSTFTETRPPAGGGVSRLRVDGMWTTYTTADGLASDSISAIAAGPDGSMWFGGSGGVTRYKPAE